MPRLYLAVIKNTEVPISQQPLNRFISVNAGLILRRLGVWMDTPCGSIILKNQDNPGAQCQVILLSLKSVGPRCEAPGIEVCRAE